MTDLTSHKNIYVALAAAQATMEIVAKGAINPAFKGEGKPKGTAYADLADVVNAVKPALTANGICFFHQMIVGDVNIMRTSLVHGETETRIDCDVPLIVSKNDMQGMKSATTYAKRVGLESVTGVAPEDDDGNAAAKAAPKARDQDNTHDVAVGSACVMLHSADSLDDLAGIWRGLTKAVQADQRVVVEKDRRKAELQMKSANLGDDHIPY